MRHLWFYKRRCRTNLAGFYLNASNTNQMTFKCDIEIYNLSNLITQQNSPNLNHKCFFHFTNASLTSSNANNSRKCLSMYMFCCWKYRIETKHVQQNAGIYRFKCQHLCLQMPAFMRSNASIYVFKCWYFPLQILVFENSNPDFLWMKFEHLKHEMMPGFILKAVPNCLTMSVCAHSTHSEHRLLS